MFTATSSVYAANYSSRALCSRKASKESHMFLIGTCSLHDDNDINIIEYQEDSNSIISIASFHHHDHINALETSSHDPDLFISSSLNKSNKYGLTMWRIPNHIENIDSSNTSTDTSGKLQEIATLDTDSTRLSVAKWHHMKDTIISSDCHQLISYSISDADVVVNTKLNFPKTENQNSKLVVPCLAWDPHSAATLCATAVGSTLHICDLRKAEIASSLTQAHDGLIRYISKLFLTIFIKRKIIIIL